VKPEPKLTPGEFVLAKRNAVVWKDLDDHDMMPGTKVPFLEMGMAFKHAHHRRNAGERDMTRGELKININMLFQTLDLIQDDFKQKYPQSSVHQRFNTIRDQLMLVALDLKLPLVDVNADKKDNAPVDPTG
jgi:hypothetical protein